MLIQLPLPRYIPTNDKPWPQITTQHVVVSPVAKRMHQLQAETLTCLRRSS